MSGQGRHNIYFGAAAAGAAALALFGFISVPGGGGAQRTLIIICSLLLLALCALYVYIILLSVDREPNYFLFDRLSGRNIPLSELRWRMVDDKLTLYISENFGSEIFLWKSDALLDEDRYGYHGALGPLIAYRMLCNVARDEGGEYFRLLETAEERTVSVLCRLLEGAGEEDMARAIMSYKRGGGAREDFRGYLSANTRYIQSRMLGYVRRHIEYFY